MVFWNWLRMILYPKNQEINAFHKVLVVKFSFRLLHNLVNPNGRRIELKFKISWTTLSGAFECWQTAANLHGESEAINCPSTHSDSPTSGNQGYAVGCIWMTPPLCQHTHRPLPTDETANWRRHWGLTRTRTTTATRWGQGRQLHQHQHQGSGCGGLGVPFNCFAGRTCFACQRDCGAKLLISVCGSVFGIASTSTSPPFN